MTMHATRAKRTHRMHVTERTAWGGSVGYCTDCPDHHDMLKLDDGKVLSYRSHRQYRYRFAPTVTLSGSAGSKPEGGIR